mmetsp:Transcript_41/g.113  ORF Transcript_41/g.113 Transcript_41/m.113 type:complete len:207 (+) Transcript_41:1143-1763(+)
MRPDSRRHRHALFATVRMFPRTVRDVPRPIPSSRTFRTESDTDSTASAKFWIDKNMSLDSSPFRRSPSKAAEPLPTTVNKVTVSTSATSVCNSRTDPSTSGSAGSPFLAPFFCADFILLSTKGWTTSGRASMPFSIAAIMSPLFSTHCRDRRPRSCASWVADWMRSPSTNSRMISNLEASIFLFEFLFGQTLSSVVWSSCPKATIS